jgi:hypothetical protein
MNIIDTTYNTLLPERRFDPKENFPTTSSETYPELLKAAGRQMAATGKSYLIRIQISHDVANLQVVSMIQKIENHKGRSIARLTSSGIFFS